MKEDFYQRITDQIISSLEQGVRPWMKPWNAEHAAGRITRPLRAPKLRAFIDVAKKTVKSFE
jgi:antirestriction protein ArdC